MRRLRSLVWLLTILVATIGSGNGWDARAAKLDDALGLLLSDSYSDTVTAIGDIVGSGDPKAAVILEAMAGNQLQFSATSKLVVLSAKDGKLSNAATGDAIAATPADLTPVRLNNRVRTAVQAALGAMTLLSPDPAKRLEAAQSIFKSRDASKLAPIEAALEREADPVVRLEMEAARAVIVIGLTDLPDDTRIAAIVTLRARADQTAIAALQGLPSTTAQAVREAAGRATAEIESRLAIWRIAQNLWYGLSLGSVLLLAAIGLAITFGVMGVINMAHGEMVMIGAYTTFVVQEVIRTSFPGLFDYSLIFAVPLAFLVAGAIGIAIERSVIRFLYGRPLETLLATWGISLILQQAVRTWFGPTNREVGAPNFMSGAFKIGELVITWNRLWIIVFAAAIFVGLLLALKYTAFGLHMRAVTQNRRMANAMGIPTARVDALTFGLGSGIAGLAGVALSQIDNVSPNLGQNYIVDSFLVVVFGGVGNLWGTLVGAMSLGIANKLLEPFAGAVLGKIILLIAVIMFIQKRPRGLFALKGRSVDA
jgi:urea transport system permease protein